MLFRPKMLDKKVFVIVRSVIPDEVVGIIICRESAKQSLGDCP